MKMGYTKGVAIARMFCAIRTTQDGDIIEAMKYGPGIIEGNEIVTITYSGGYSERIDVTGMSGMQMLKTVMARVK